jgi:IclR family transcriptional regulator, acetate operon repressor
VPVSSSGDVPGASGVQAVHRTFDVLEALADRGGRLPVAEVAAVTGLPMATAHRLLRTLVERGYLRQLTDRSYALGFRLVPLGAAANVLVGSGVESVLRQLVDQLGETANVAVLSGGQAEYVAQVPSRYTMRMFTEIGRRVDLHSTGVGKALLARLDVGQVAGIVRRHGLPRHTGKTIATATALLAELDLIRAQGFAVDDEEQEIGVRCVAVAIEADTLGGMAVSVSGPTARMTDEVVTRAVPLLRAAAARLAADLLPPAP